MGWSFMKSRWLTWGNKGLNAWSAIARRAQAAARELLGSLFYASPQGTRSWIGVGWYLGLYGLGLALWGYLLEWGQIPFGLHDWAHGTGHRLAFLQNAARGWNLPLHMPDGSALSNITDRFISVPDTILSPQVLLLRYVDLATFVVLNVAILYSVGFLGLVMLSRKFRLSGFAFGVLFFLVLFNGHVTDHVVVGHLHWVGYYLLPFFVLLVFEALEAQPGWFWISKMGLLLFLVFLQGAFHLYAMSIMFLGFLALGTWRLLRPVASSIIAGLLLSLGRILPAALVAREFDNEFLSGFTSVGQLLASLVEIRLPTPEQALSHTPLSPLGWWEIDHFIGVLGLAFLVTFGLVLAARSRLRRRLLSELALPVGAMAFLSVGRVYKLINITGIPILAGERVATRFFVFSVLFVLVLGAINLQDHLEESRPGTGRQIGLLALLALVAHDLWQHIKLWRVRSIYGLFPKREVDLTGEFIANHADSPYELALAVGWGVALITLAILVVLTVAERRSSARRLQ